jgi:hypothetical protein
VFPKLWREFTHRDERIRTYGSRRGRSVILFQFHTIFSLLNGCVYKHHTTINRSDTTRRRSHCVHKTNCKRSISHEHRHPRAMTSSFFDIKTADAQSMIISYNGTVNNERMETQYTDQLQLA